MVIPEASPRPDSKASQRSSSSEASYLPSAGSPRRSSVRLRSEMGGRRSEKKALAMGIQRIRIVLKDLGRSKSDLSVFPVRKYVTPRKGISLHLLLARELRRRLAGDLPEGTGKRRYTGIAEIGRKLLNRQAGIDRQPLDRRRDAGPLAPALEGKLRLRREQPRQRPRRGAD